MTGKTVTTHVVTGTIRVTVVRDETVTGVTTIVTGILKLQHKQLYSFEKISGKQSYAQKGVWHTETV